MEKAYAAWRQFQDRVLAPVAAFVFVGSTLLALLEVGRRYVLGRSFEWQQDAVTYFILCAVFLFFAIAQQRETHLTVTLVPDLCAAVGGRARRAAELIRLFARVFSLAFLCTVVWWGIPEIEDAIKYESRSESLAFPMWPFLAVLLAAFALMAIGIAFQVYRAVQALRGVSVLEEPHEAGDATH